MRLRNKFIDSDIVVFFTGSFTPGEHSLQVSFTKKGVENCLSYFKNENTSNSLSKFIFNDLSKGKLAFKWEIVFDSYNYSSIDEQLEKECEIDLHGPLGIHLIIGAKALTILTPFDWERLLKVKETQKELYFFFDLIIKTLRGNKYLLMPGSNDILMSYTDFVSQGLSHNEILKKIIDDVTEPCENEEKLLKVIGTCVGDGFFERVVSGT